MTDRSGTFRPTNSLPVVRRLPTAFCLETAFERISDLPGCLWLDSASEDRYSFLTADPIQTIVASVSDCDPWPALKEWCRNLPHDHRPDLPPFQGGIAGLIGYEAASWLEPVGLARDNDLPTPAMSLGLYDWVIALDHHSDQAWLISQGLGNPENRMVEAIRRADEIESLIREPAPLLEPAPLSEPALLSEPAPLSEPGCDPKSTDASYETLPAVPITVAGHETDRDGVYSNFTSEGFRGVISQIVERIHAGDSFQVNLAQRLIRHADVSSPDLYRRLRAANPAPFSAFYRGDNFEVLSSSPEGFLKVRSGVVQTRPIKGTIHRTGDPAQDQALAQRLRDSEKDRAENVMIVDLMRNDLSRVCCDDSVRVKKLCEIERYQYVQHLVSVVEGKLRDDQTVADLLAACFPGGSVTGAPKIEAMRTIAQLEPNPRGPYCGSIGYISCGGAADFNILIRTITAAHGCWQLPVGAGITARSDPASEEAETWAKAEGMLQAFRVCAALQ